eukprot:5393528-Alexandrium_andersonii.AAC.1
MVAMAAAMAIATKVVAMVMATGNGDSTIANTTMAHESPTSSRQLPLIVYISAGSCSLSLWLACPATGCREPSQH